MIKNYLRPIISIVLLFGIWISNYSKPIPKIDKGVIDLSDWDLTKDGSIKLSGNWKFYPSIFLNDPIQADTINYIYLKVPGVWNDNRAISNHGYGTYRILIKKAKTDLSNRYALRFNSVGVAFKVFINGELKYIAGEPGSSKEQEIPKYRPGVVPFEINSDVIDIIIWVSNYHHYKGGLWKYVWFGEEESIREQFMLYYFFDWFLIGSLLIMGLFHIIMYLTSRRQLSNFIFGVMNILFVLRIGVNGNMFFANYLGFSWNVMVFLEYFTFYLIPFVAISYIRLLYPANISKKYQMFSGIVAILFLSTIFFSTPLFYTQFPMYHRVYVLIMFIVIILLIFDTAFQSKGDSIVFLIGFLIFFISVTIDIFIASHVLFYRTFSPIGILVFTYSQSFLLTRRFAETLKKSEILTLQLEFQNKNQELIIEERTSEIFKQKEEIEKSSALIGRAYDEIKMQHSQLQLQKKEIETYNVNLNSAIRYAQKIQNALMPSPERLKKYLNDHFIIYMPKDMVSGDFYWIREKDNQLLLAVADCTGHGVPGAFMSLLGISLLTEATNKIGIMNPGEILNQLPDLLRNLIMVDQTENQGLGDGMEIALLLIDSKKNKIIYSGARMDIILIRDNKLIEIKSDRNRLSWGQTYNQYKNQEVDIKQGDMFYIFSDGYPDQLGGYPRKKFTITKLKNELLKIHLLPIIEQQAHLMKRIENWMRYSKNQVDDITFLGIRF